LPQIINQIIIFSSLLFTTGLISLFKKDGLKAGTIIIFLSCILNFTGFSNYNSVSAEGQAIGAVISMVILIHLFIQNKITLND